MRIAALIVLLISNPVFAEAEISKRDVAKCGLIKGALERLQCFDNIAKKHSLDGIQNSNPKIKDKGDWIVSISINPLDDSKTVIANLKADSGADYLGRKVGLVARCKSNVTDFYINWQDFLASNTSVTSRIGKNEAQTFNWDPSTNNKATFHPRPIEFLRNVMGESSFVAQITPYNSSPTTAVFDITGIDNALEPLMKTCGWGKESKR